MERIEELCCYYIAMIRSVYLVHQNHHWITSGENFYGNHLLFERIYKSAAEDADLAAEKFIGLFGTEVLDLHMQAQMIGKTLEDFSSGEPVGTSLEAEKKFLDFSEKFYKILKEQDSMSLGLDDMLMSIASNREGAVYLLQQVQGHSVEKINPSAARADVDLKKTAMVNELIQELKLSLMHVRNLLHKAGKQFPKEMMKIQKGEFTLSTVNGALSELNHLGNKFKDEKLVEAIQNTKSLLEYCLSVGIFNEPDTIEKNDLGDDDMKPEMAKRVAALKQIKRAQEAQSQAALDLQKKLRNFFGAFMASKNWGPAGVTNLIVTEKDGGFTIQYNIQVPANAPPFTNKKMYPQGLNQFKQEMMNAVSKILNAAGVNASTQLITVNGA